MLRRLTMAAAVLALIAATPAWADQVVELLPGGHASLSPSTGGDDGSRISGETGPAHPDVTVSTGRSSNHHEVDGDLGLQARQFAAGAELGCAVPDGANPRDLNVTNLANYPLPAGTRIKWQVRDKGLSGFFALINELPAGRQLVAEGILPAGATSASACSARVI
jgi:hypothetical protein